MVVRIGILAIGHIPDGAFHNFNFIPASPPVSNKGKFKRKVKSKREVGYTVYIAARLL